MFILSLPVRGAWIEIPWTSPVGAMESSLPVRGAWIEIISSVLFINLIGSLPVRGAWIEMSLMKGAWACTSVAPRAGSVD